ncbi:MAG: type II secretion system F family protein [Roseburia sp.]|nr:type II secretion system F family protein [Roseburia sp.]MCM1099226.1 type II secretion system F family protein [Ruminococcus flavefaciens]
MLSEGSEKKGSSGGKTNLKRRDYHKYRWKAPELIAAILASAGITIFLAFFFYRSLWAAIPLAPLGIAWFRRTKRQRGGRQREELAGQFRECILAVTSALGAGYSVENAFLACGQDMEQMFGREALICEELRLIRRGLAINISLEELLLDFGERSGSEEILQFGEVFSIAKRNGGNMAEIIGSSSELIGRKIDLRRELEILLGGKRMELMIMKLMPFFVLFYVGTANAGYFDMLYHNGKGVLIMTGCLAVYVGAYVLGEVVIERIV